MAARRGRSSPDSAATTPRRPGSRAPVGCVCTRSSWIRATPGGSSSPSRRPACSGPTTEARRGGRSTAACGRNRSPTRLPRWVTACTASRCTRRVPACCSCRSTGTSCAATTPASRGKRSAGTCRPWCPSKSKRCHDPGRAPGTSADARARRRRGEAPRRGSGHAALGPRRARGRLSDAAWDDPRPGHATAPSVREVLRLRTGSVPRTAGRPAARRGPDGGRAPAGRGGHGRRRLGASRSSGALRGSGEKGLTPMEPIIEDRVIPPGEVWARVVASGPVLRIVDLEGKQAGDFLCYHAANPEERYNAADTMKYAGTIFLTRGHGIYSDMGRRLFTVVEDTCGRHDTIGGCWRAATNPRHHRRQVTPHSPRTLLLAPPALALVKKTHGTTPI